MPFNKLKDLELKLEGALAKLEEAPKAKVVPEAKEDKAELQRRGANAYIFKRITGRDLKDEVIATRAINPQDLPNWLAEQFKNDLIERMTLLANVEGMFQEYTIPSNVNSLSIPKKKGALKAYRIAPSQDAINSALQSEKVTFATEALMTFTSISDQATDETVTATIEILKQSIAVSLVDGLENVLINGDTAADATNINGAAVGADATDQTRLFDGLRKITEVRDAAGFPSKLDFAGVLSFVNFMGMKKLMGKDSVRAKDLVFIVSPSTFHNLVTSIPEMITVDKYGAAATIVTGEVAKIGAIPVVVSEYVPENLDATGKFDAAGDKTIVLLVNKTMFAMATRGGATYETDRVITNRTDLFTGHRDVDFKELTGGLGVVSSVVGYNVAV
jgi:HK97 family phage major capsid protein